MNALSKIALVCIGLVGLSACQSTDKTSNEVATNSAANSATSSVTNSEIRKALKELGYKCDLYKKTGSHVRKKLCSTAQQREAEKVASQNALKRMAQGANADMSTRN